MAPLLVKRRSLIIALERNKGFNLSFPVALTCLTEQIAT